MSSAETDGVPGARPGDVLNGKYRVEKVLGAGGMGVVVAATHLQLDEKVAIKFLLPEAAKSADVVNRFQREARAAVKIKSEHVARVSDVGQMENGSPFMVMEFLQGQDLADTIETHGALPVPAAVEYVLQACEALAEAHAAGIVHRDLKPANLFLAQRADGSPCIKVLDFGISKMVNSLSMPGMTKTTAVMGSPLYMSPEQMKSSKDVDHRTDIWSLGAILYELLSGNPPFIADTMPQLCLMILQEPLGPLAQFRHDVPPQLEAVIRRCQEKDPNHRYQNVAELAAALAPFVTGRARLSAERVADVLRTSAARGNSLPGATPAPPQAGMPPYGQTGPAGAPFGAGSNPQLASNPHLGASGAAYGQPGPHTGGNFVAQAQTGGSFAQSNPSNPGIGAAATVMGAPAMMGATAHGHGPPMAGSTASSWEGSMGAPKKKGSAGVIIGAIAAVAVLAGIGIAVLALGGSKGGNANAASGLPTPTSAADSAPGGLVPTVTLGGDAPPAASSAASAATPADPAPSTPGAKPGKPPPTKPGTTATTRRRRRRGDRDSHAHAHRDDPAEHDCDADEERHAGHGG
jgi:serine/threonine protein kinase